MAVSIVALTGALEGLATALDASTWIHVTLAGLGAAGVVAVSILDVLRERREADVRRNALWRRPPQRVRDLARDRDAPYILGVETEARGALKQIGLRGRAHLPYVERDIDASGELASMLSDAASRSEATVVIVSGPAKAGKTRTLYEAVARTLSDAWLITPTDAVSLATLARGGPPREIGDGPCAVWLDDLEPFARPVDGLNLDTLLAFGEWRRPVVVLATAGGKGVRRAGAADFSDTTSEIVRRYPPVRLRSELSADERARVAARYPAPAASDIEAIGEFMIAAEELVDRYEQGTNREGIALTRAAVDWRRAGILRPVPREALQELHAIYLAVEPSATSFQRGLEWATTPLYAHVALLRGSGEYQPYDYIAANEHRAIPSAMWEALFERHARGVEFSDIGVAADGFDQPDYTERGFRAGDQARDAGSALNLAVLLERRGEFAEAEAARRRGEIYAREAVEFGYTSQHYKNAVMLEGQGNLGVAEQLYRKAQASSDPEIAARAGEALARLTKGRGA